MPGSQCAIRARFDPVLRPTELRNPNGCEWRGEWPLAIESHWLGFFTSAFFRCARGHFKCVSRRLVSSNSRFAGFMPLAAE